MRPIPTGTVVPTDDGLDLVLTRTYRAPIDDVWASITESERTARWFGPWHGDAAPGATITVTMTAEEGDPEGEAVIEACDPPYRLALSFVDEAGTWNLEAQLSESDGTTELRLIHHLPAEADPSDAGPGWEYYLDRLTASREDAPLPDFADYEPAQRAYYERLAGEVTAAE